MLLGSEEIAQCLHPAAPLNLPEALQNIMRQVEEPTDADFLYLNQPPQFSMAPASCPFLRKVVYLPDRLLHAHRHLLLLLITLLDLSLPQPVKLQVELLRIPRPPSLMSEGFKLMESSLKHFKTSPERICSEVLRYDVVKGHIT